MKINHLSVQGFGPFKTEQHVNFDAFDDDGIFLMGGKTGAGKSSILDAICFALYDSVPRYDGTKARLRSDHCLPEDPTLVSLEFTAGDTLYRVERSPEYERPKARGTGTTTNKAAATLFERRGEEWHGIAASPREVGPQIAELVGLNKDQFLQVILLAQNRFQQFLLAKSEDRQGVLRSLFGTRRFQDYELTVTEQRKSLELELGTRRATLAQMLEQAASIARSAGLGEGAGEDSVDGTLDSAVEAPVDVPVDAPVDAPVGAPVDASVTLLEVPVEISRATIDPWLHSLDAAVSTRLAGASSAAESANGVHAAATTAHNQLLVTHAGQQRRAEAIRRLEQLLADAAVLEGVRIEVATAARAEVVWGAVQGSRRAADAATLAHENLEVAHEEFRRIRDADAGTDSRTDAGTDARTDTDTGLTADSDEGQEAAVSALPRAAELSTTIDATTRERGTLQDGVATERELPALRALLDEHHHAAEAAKLELASTIERAAELPKLIAADTNTLTELRVSAARADDAKASIERLHKAQAAAAAAEATETKLATARTKELASGQARTTASARLDELRAARLSGHAAELAAELRDGEPCAVCGATEHPRPSTTDGPTVGQADIDAAAKELEARQHEATEASTAANALAEELAKQRGVANDQSHNELATALKAAVATLVSATDAATSAEKLATKLDARRLEQQSAESAISALREALAAATELHTTTRTRLDANTERVAALRGKYASVGERDASLLTFLELAHALSSAMAAASTSSIAAASADSELASQLAAHGFTEVAAAEAAHLSAAERTERERRLKNHDEALAAVNATLADPTLAELPDEPVELEGSADSLHTLAEARDAAIAARATVAGHASSLATLSARIEAELAASATLIERFEIVSRLAATLEGKVPNERRMKLESYVLAAELEQIVAAANGRLSVMSAGRYTLEHDDSIGYRGTQSGLGLSILDSHTGLQRATHSLSGGETFLASLALALGLAEVVTGRAGGIRLDTLFIDEGFGSLDADTLEIAMATLDGLRTGGRTIGLISHVEAMKEQIHASLQVRVSEQGWSTISQPAVQPSFAAV